MQLAGGPEVGLVGVEQAEKAEPCDDLADGPQRAQILDVEVELPLSNPDEPHLGIVAERLLLRE